MLKDVEASLTPERVEKLQAEDTDKYGDLPEEGVAVSIQYDFGDTVEQAVEFFGEEICKSMIEGHIRFGLQGMIRNKLAEGKSPQQIQAEIFNVETGEHIYKPSKAGPKKSAVEKEKSRLMKLDPEARSRQKEELLKMLADMEE